MDLVEEHKVAGGRQQVWRHLSQATQGSMAFSIFLPPAAEKGAVPLLTYLSGLTCTWQNVTEKGDFQRAAAEAGVAVLCPDTSPRGDDVADDEAALNAAAGKIRAALGRKITMKFTPQLVFRADGSFEEAARIDALLKGKAG